MTFCRRAGITVASLSLPLMHAARSELGWSRQSASATTLESMEKSPMNATVMTTATKKSVRELKSLRTADYKKALERHRCCRCCRCCRGG